MVRHDIAVGIDGDWFDDDNHAVQALCTHPAGIHSSDRIKIFGMSTLRWFLDRIRFIVCRRKSKRCSHNFVPLIS